MGWFSYKCNTCENTFRKSLPLRKKTQECVICHEEAEVILKVGSVQVVERLDNGAMARAVERLHNIEEIMDERDAKSTKRNMEGLEGLDE